MKSINTKLVLSVLGIALLATPAPAQRAHRTAPSTSQYQGSTYPNPQVHSGSEQSRQTGNDTIGGE